MVRRVRPAFLDPAQELVSGYLPGAAPNRIREREFTLEAVDRQVVASMTLVAIVNATEKSRGRSCANYVSASVCVVLALACLDSRLRPTK